MRIAATCGAAAFTAFTAALCPQTSGATEGGASAYLLGSAGPGAAMLPPIEGVFFLNTLYHYDGQASADRQFLVGGNLVAGLKANIDAMFPTVLWTPTTDLAGGVFAIGAALPVGVPSADVSAVITGPRGRTFALSRSEGDLLVGDPLVTAALAWERGKFWVQASSFVNVPVGDYQAGHLSNIAFHRWAVDTSVAVTWHDAARGWDLSAKTGFTFNGENPSTDYDSGTEWHLEAAVERTFSPAFSAGLQAYHLEQVTGDSGAGATLGAFKGRVTGVGATAAYNFKIGALPATFRLHAMKEFHARNRLEGNAVWLDFTMPIALHPKAAARAK